MKSQMDRRDILRTFSAAKAELGKYLFGLDHIIDIVLQASVTSIPYDRRGGKEVGQPAILLKDVPGTGKTALCELTAAVMQGKFQKIQGQPALMTQDFTGGVKKIADQYHTIKGPIFANFVLFDEINRTHPKGQAGLLEVMESRVVSLHHIEGDTLVTRQHTLYPTVEGDEREYFLLVATANPIEQEGTYPLPEAQQERFTYVLKMGYPEREKEKQMRMANVIPDARALRGEGMTEERSGVEALLDLPTLLDISAYIRSTVAVSDAASEYMMRLIENSRPGMESRKYASPALLHMIDDYVNVGISPRGNYHLEPAAITQAFFDNSDVVQVQHVKAVAPHVLPMRLNLREEAIANRITAEQVVAALLADTCIE